MNDATPAEATPAHDPAAASEPVTSTAATLPAELGLPTVPAESAVHTEPTELAETTVHAESAELAETVAPAESTLQPGPVAGVGPWPGGREAWPSGDEAARYDPELLEHGDTRNVIDRYRYWTMEAIVADLDESRHPFHVAIENWQHDMNIGSIVRSANAFAADTVHIVGRRRWNKRGAMVTDRYQHVVHHPEVADLVAWAEAEGLPIVAVDNVPGCVPMETFEWPERCVMLFGQEGPGLSEEALEAALAVVEITQYGSTRSINASAAAAVTMHSWVMQRSQMRPGA